MIEVIVALIGGILLGIGMFYILKRGQGANSEEISESIQKNLEDLVPKALMEANEYLVRTAKESLSSETKQNRRNILRLLKRKE